MQNIQDPSRRQRRMKVVISSILLFIIVAGTGVLLFLYKSELFAKKRPLLDEHGMPYVSEEEKAAIEAAKKESKAKSDAEAKSIDSRFFTFSYGSEFLDYIQTLVPELAPKFDGSYSSETNLQWMATLAQFSRYFIEFKGKLNNDLHNADDYAILLKGEPHSDSSLKITSANQTANASEVYDVDTQYKDPSVDATANSSLHERFDITNNDLSHASYLIFLQKPANGESTVTFSQVAEYEKGKFGIMEEKQMTRSNIMKIKEIAGNPNFDYIAETTAKFQIVRYSSQMSWVY